MEKNGIQTMKNTIEIRNLSKGFESKQAVDNLSLCVPEGSIFAFLGPNGAGKTTTIQMSMNVLQPTSGSIQILGTQAANLGPIEFQRIGYVTENQQMPYDMTVKEFIEFCKPLYPNWDNTLAAKLWKQFDLPPNQSFQTLSRGMKMKAMLLSSLAYRPQLLVLDEPFSGLDPRVRDELINGILEISDQDNWTVFISTHDIYEVEQLANWVGILDRGKLRHSAPVADLQKKFRAMIVTCSRPPAMPLNPPASWTGFRITNHLIQFVERCYEETRSESLIQKTFPDATHIEAHPMSLRDITLALTEPNTY